MLKSQRIVNRRNLLYMLYIRKILYRHTTSDFYKQAYKFAVGNNITINEVLRANLKAPKDWLREFLKSHPNLYVRKREVLSMPQPLIATLHSTPIL